MTDRSDIDIEAVKAYLAGRKAELEQVSESARDAGRTVELDQTRQGRLSRIDALQGQEMSKAAERRRQQELQRIQATFKRIAEGEYGYCASCGDEIDKRRLDVDPTTPLCIDCASESGR